MSQQFGAKFILKLAEVYVAVVVRIKLVQNVLGFRLAAVETPTLDYPLYFADCDSTIRIEIQAIESLIKVETG